MRIAEISELTQLSIDTIRFYEKSGMLPALPRDGRGWRQFTPEARDWLEVLGHLRRTGMPLEDMRAFATSVHGPDADSPEQRDHRLALLQRHADRLAHQKAQIADCEAYLNRKIATYRKDRMT